MIANQLKALFYLLFYPGQVSRSFVSSFKADISGHLKSKTLATPTPFKLLGILYLMISEFKEQITPVLLVLLRHDCAWDHVALLETTAVKLNGYVLTYRSD